LNLLLDKHRKEIEGILAHYPPEEKRSAVMPLLYLAQREYGSVTAEAVEEIAAVLDLETTQVASLVGFYTLYHDRPGGKYRIQICTDLPCALRGGEAFAHALCEALGIELGGTTPDGLVTVEAVMCLAACDKAPMFQLQAPEGIHYHELQSVETALELIDQLRKESAADG
jgi:NADH-quinone oxidoreductase subunit E